MSLSCEETNHDPENKHEPINMQDNQCRKHQSQEEIWRVQNLSIQVRKSSQKELFLPIGSVEIFKSGSNDADRESKESEEDPGKDKQNITDILERLVGILEVTVESVDANENITRIVDKENQNSDSEVVGQEREDEQEDCQDVVEEHLPKFRCIPFVNAIVNECI